ncbi:MAG: glycogen synthase GlgA [Firmicutes bacterium]|nr:glycogen synthase GlgA [Bacillota bacterium]
MKILFIASESVPFFKSGGLADVVGALPKELRRQGIDVSVLLPKYGILPRAFRDTLDFQTSFTTHLGWRNQYCGLETVNYQGIPFYFIDNQYYFNRDVLYGYDDDAERYAFFCRAALQALPKVKLRPDIIHLHDWQTGLVSALLKAHYGQDPFYRDTKTVFTIHNLKYQGVFPKTILTDMLELGWDLFNADGLEFYDNVNFLKAGLAYSDLLTTVSPTYAQEIQYPFFGESLHGFLQKRKDDLLGIINGIDYEVYNPSDDPFIFKTYHIDSPEYKLENKLRLQEQLHLPIDGEIPMIGIISRLVSQKGLDLVGHVLDDILAQDLQLVVLGTGDQYYEDMFRIKASHYPSKLSANIRFDNTLAHRIYAGTDMFLMPSLFEPCGLSQLIALRYGSLPIVRETGGLNDTVTSYNIQTGEGNGFSFTNYNAHDMLYTINRALELYHNKPVWAAIRKNAMEMDFSWNRSAAEYIRLYQKLVNDT